jgi:hypothetical protein
VSDGSEGWLARPVTALAGGSIQCGKESEGKMALPFPGANSNQERSKVPNRRITKQKNIRFDPETLKALQELKELYGVRFTESDLIRDAIIEKLERDKKRIARKADKTGS